MPEEEWGKVLSNLQDKYRSRIHEVFHDEEVPLLDRAVTRIQERGRVAKSHVAGIHKLYAHLANERPSLHDIAEEYELSERAVQNGMAHVQELAGTTIDTRGAPKKLRDHARAEAQHLFDNQLDKTAAAEKIGKQYHVSADWVRNKLLGESHSKYAERGLNDQVSELLDRRPQTNKELTRRLNLPQNPEKYMRYIDAEHIHSASGHRIYIWYRPEDVGTAQAYDAVRTATHKTQPGNWQAILYSVADRMDEVGLLPGDSDGWVAQREGLYDHLQDAQGRNPQQLGALQRRVPEITDFLAQYDGQSRFRTQDVVTYLGTDTPSERREYGKALAILEDEVGILSSYGNPRNYAAGTYDDVDVFLIGAALDWLR